MLFSLGDQSDNSSNNKKKNPLWQRVVISLVLLLGAFGVMSVGFLPDTLEVGQVSPKDFYAPREVVDRYMTEERREEAEKQVPEVYDLDPNVKELSIERLKESFDILISLNNDFLDTKDEAAEENGDNWDENEHRKELTEKYLEEVPLTFHGNEEEEPIEIPIGITDSSELRNAEQDAESIIVSLMDQGIKTEAMENINDQIDQRIEILPYTSEVQDFTAAVIKETITPNMFYNEEATEERRQEAREEVDPVTIVKGEVVVREGERLTERHLMILEDLGLQRAHGDYLMLLGLFLFVVIALFLIGMYIYFYRQQVFYNTTLLILLGLIFVATLGIARISSMFSGYLVPAAMAAILFTVLYGARLSMVLVAVLAILVGLMPGNDLNTAILALVSGFVGTYSVAKLQQRGDLTRAGFYVALTNALVIVSLALVDGGFQLETDSLFDLTVKSSYGVFNGFLSAILAIGFLPYLESTFGLTTSVRLLELSNPNQPLLKKLLVEAPGTYHHSIIVANLAETAAEEVNADAILARVGAYYHDIGKINRPYFFIENQLSKDNPHDKISPTLSSLIITSHIKDGLELAKKHKLPQSIIDIIREHHGTKMVSYFYSKACDREDNKEDIKEEDFRYKGPKPQSKESAIILLADAVEAAVRTISTPNPGKIEGLVRKLVKQHLAEGQLDECHLTLKDLNSISKSFVQVLAGIFHSRIEYPENLPERRSKNGTSDRKSDDAPNNEEPDRNDEQDNGENSH